MTIPLEVTRKAWARAASFPAEKEKCYLEHASVQRFEDHRGKTPELGPRVLEYGCGGGSDTLSYRSRNCRVTYCDIVPGNVRATMRRLESAGLSDWTFGFELGDSHPLPFASEIFDLANAHGVLHHLEEPLPVVKELRRVLRPGGLLYAMLYTEMLRQRAQPTIERLMREHAISTHEAFCWYTDGPDAPYARAYTDAQGEALFAAAGFEVLCSTVYNSGDFRTFLCRKGAP